MGYSESAGVVLRHVHDHACRYFPELQGSDVRVRLLEEQHRALSSLYRLEVRNLSRCFNIFAKGMPRGNSAREDSPARQSRARLAPQIADFGERTLLEYHALRSIDAYFGGLDDARFGAIRVLDIIEDPRTIIMLENTDPSLRSMFASSNRREHILGRTSGLEPVFSNAGAWLRAYSRMPRDGVELLTRHAHRDDFVASIENLTAFLADAIGDTVFFQQLAETVDALARSTLPQALPLGLGHGDYAMRNILVGTGGRVTAFDTGARWRVPVYEDIAYFLVKLESNRLQIVTQGHAVHPRSMEMYKTAFLSGYFDAEAIPESTVSLFEVQSLLDSWCSQFSIYSGEARGLTRGYNRIFLALLNRQYRKLAVSRLNSLRAALPA